MTSHPRPWHQEFIVVCTLENLVPCRGAAALVHGQQVALFRLPQGSVYAIGNLDPFSGANVMARGIIGDLKGELVVASPIYKQHFSLVNGRCLENPEIMIPVYPVRTLKGIVEIGCRPLHEIAQVA